MFGNKVLLVTAVALAGCNVSVDDGDQTTTPTITPIATPVATATPAITPTPIVDASAVEFEFGSTWAFNDQGQDLGLAWVAGNFDDTAWNRGSGLFGFNVEFTSDSPLAPQTVTNLASYQEVFAVDEDLNPTSYYFRKGVELSAAELAVLQQQDYVYLQAILDDAAVVYVNGEEATRSPYMLENEVPFDAVLGTEKGRSQSADYAQVVTLRLPTALFKAGDNTLAVQVVDRYSSRYPDAAFDAKLSLTHNYADKLDGPYVTHQDSGQVVAQSRSAQGISQQVFASAKDANIEVQLPEGLGSFTVALQSSHEPEPWQYGLPSKFTMTSDIEGNIVALVNILVQAGVMDAEYNWTYGTGHLYHMGDMFDRGEYVAESTWLLYHLENQAKAAGGDVHFILGNHDLMNLYGDWRYLDESYVETAAYLGMPLTALYSADTELGRWLRSKNLIEVAGDVAFTHAGFNVELVDAITAGLLTVEQLNETGRFHLDNFYGNYAEDNTRLTYLPSRLYWARDVVNPFREKYADRPDKWLGGESKVGGDLNFHLDRGLAAFDATKLVVGHTVFADPSFLYDGKVLAVDVDHVDNLAIDNLVEWTEYKDGAYLHHTYELGGSVASVPVQTLATPEYPVAK